MRFPSCAVWPASRVVATGAGVVLAVEEASRRIRLLVAPGGGFTLTMAPATAAATFPSAQRPQP